MSSHVEKLEKAGLLDADGYPSEEALEMIRRWDLRRGFKGLVELVQKLWRYPDYLKLYERRNSYWLRLATGGWSGNESIVGALEENVVFYGFCWVMSARGGLHVYEIPKEMWERCSLRCHVVGEER